MWSKHQIRLARKIELVPILIQRSYRLYPLDDDNYRILPDPDDPTAPVGVIVKRNFWIWNEKNVHGNTIDFFMNIEGKSFNQAMQIIENKGRIGPDDPRKWAIPTCPASSGIGTPAHNTDDDGNYLRQECGNHPKIRG